MWEDENSIGLTIATPTVTASKVYDGANTVASVTAGALTGVAVGDTVTVNATATYDNANVGTGKTITVTYTLSGADAGKYSAPAPTLLTTGEITAKALTIAAPSVANKEYDGTTTATVTAGALTGIVGSDVVTVGSATGTFADANVGAGKTVAVAYTLAGAQAGNYTLANGTATADITAKALTIAAPTVANKEYDGTTTATVTAGALTGVVGSDTVTVSATGTFADANVETGKTVAVAYTLAGAQAGNYTLANGTATADITVKALTSIGNIAGVAMVGNELTVGAIVPNAATATYQWQIESSPSTWTDILSATNNKYTVQSGDAGKNLRVVATGTGNYTGTVTSASFAILP